MIPVGVDAGNSGLRAGPELGPQLGARRSAASLAPADRHRRRTTAADSGAAVPLRVRLNGVRLSAPVVPVGIDEDDTVTVPDPRLAGWFRHGSLPGAGGSATLVGHVDYDGRPAAFFDLAAVAAGDEVEIDMSDGSVKRFVVTRSAYYDKADLPVGDLLGSTGPARLQLITCGGEFDRELRQYRGNIVVSAVPWPDAAAAWSEPSGVE